MTYAFDAFGRLMKSFINDKDFDGVADAVDNCPEAFNPGQENSDSDQSGDVCDHASRYGTAFAVPVAVANVTEGQLLQI